MQNDSDYYLYNRNNDAIGNDLFITDDLDLNVSNGDLALITNVESIRQSLLRRIYTSVQQYEIILNTANGLDLVGSEYGNNTFQYLSSVNNPLHQNSILQELERIFETEPRVSLTESYFQAKGNTVFLHLTYIILSNQELVNLII